MRNCALTRKSWIWLALLLLLVLGGCRDKSREPEDVSVDLAVTPYPPHVGSSTVVVNLHDVERRPITGAEISLEANMSHAGMVPVFAETSEVSPGRYEAALEFTMGGDWFILIYAMLQDGRKLEYQVELPAVGAFGGTSTP